MGWDSSNNWTKKSDAVNDATRRLIQSGYTIHGQASTREGAYWAVTAKTGESFIACSIIERKGGSVYIKNMTEGMGPRIVDCPLELLALVPGAGPYSQDWRKEVLAYHAKRLK